MVRVAKYNKLFTDNDKTYFQINSTQSVDFGSGKWNCRSTVNSNLSSLCT